MNKDQVNLDSKDTILSVLGSPEVANVGYSMRIKSLKTEGRCEGCLERTNQGSSLWTWAGKFRSYKLWLPFRFMKDDSGKQPWNQTRFGWLLEPRPKGAGSRAKDWKIMRQSEQRLIPWGVLKVVLIMIIIIMVENVACLPPEPLPYPGCHTRYPPDCLPFRPLWVLPHPNRPLSLFLHLQRR